MPTVEISELSITQSVECPLTVKDTAVVSGQLSTRNGTGAGSVSLALRRVLSHTAWAEVIFLSLQAARLGSLKSAIFLRKWQKKEVFKDFLKLSLKLCYRTASIL